MFKMNQPAVFHLHRIERSVSAIANKRFRLSNNDDIKELLSIAARSTDERVRKSLKVFMNNCETNDVEWAISA